MPKGVYKRKFEPINCKRCGKEFMPTHWNQRYCCKECSYEAIKEREYTLEYRAKKNARRRTPKYKAQRRRHNRIPEVKTRKKEREQTPERRAKMLAKIKTPEYRIEKYKRSAKERGYEWELSDNEFFKLLKQPCAYCGGTSKIGIDRVDNSKGYTKENSVPCCKDCNYMKHRQSREDFIKNCKRVANYN